MREARQVGALRVALAGASVLAGAVLAAPATAATKVRTVCHLVTDGRGDGAPYLGSSQTPPAVTGSPSDDLLSADVASDGRTVTAVLRMAAVQSPDPLAPAGRSYLFTFVVRGQATTSFLAVRTYPTGTRYEYGDYPADATGQSWVRVLGSGTGSVSTSTGQVRVSAPVAGFLPRSVRRGSTLVALAASVYREGPELPQQSQDAPVHTPFLAGAKVDDAQGDRYVVGTPSCVKP